MLSDSKAGSAALCTAAAIFIWGSGCDKDLQQLNVGMKVRNWSPHTMYFNYSLVDEYGGDLQNGAVEFKSIWNYTSSDLPNEDDFQWFVFPMLENQNYTARLSIGSEVSRVEAYFTATSIPENDKCSYYYKTDLADACKSVTSIRTQFQVAFPFIQLPFGQSFTFNATSAGTYNMAPLGSLGLINCSAADCSGLGVATLLPNGERMFTNEFFVLMPSVVRNPDVESTSRQAWSVQKFGDARDDHAQAMVPEFTFVQRSASMFCDSSAPQPDLACQAVKAISTDTAKSELSNTASICESNTCAFAPLRASAPKTCAMNNGDCASDQGCFPKGNGSVLICGPIVESCPANTDCCGNVPKGELCNQFCFRDATANAGQSELVCRGFCSQFAATCLPVFDPGTGLVREEITTAIKNKDYDFLRSVNCNSTEPGLQTVHSILGETNQIAYYPAEEKLLGKECSVEPVIICPEGCLPRGGDPKDYCTAFKGCSRASCKYNPSGSPYTRFAGDCSNPDCGDFTVDRATGYCLVPSNCSLKPGIEGGAKKKEDIDDACTPITCPGDCGECGVCDTSAGACKAYDTSDGDSQVCRDTYGTGTGAKTFCLSEIVPTQPPQSKYTCKRGDCGGCGACGRCADPIVDLCVENNICTGDTPSCEQNTNGEFECKPRTCPNDCGTCGQCNPRTGACDVIGNAGNLNSHCQTNYTGKPVCVATGGGTAFNCTPDACGVNGCGGCGNCSDPVYGICSQDSNGCANTPDTPHCVNTTPGLAVTSPVNLDAVQAAVDTAYNLGTILSQVIVSVSADSTDGNDGTFKLLAELAPDFVWTTVTYVRTPNFWECQAFTCPNDCGTCGRCNALGACEPVNGITDNYDSVGCPSTAAPVCMSENGGTEFNCKIDCGGGTPTTGCGQCGRCTTPSAGSIAGCSLFWTCASNQQCLGTGPGGTTGPFECVTSP